MIILNIIITSIILFIYSSIETYLKTVNLRYLIRTFPILHDKLTHNYKSNYCYLLNNLCLNLTFYIHYLMAIFQITQKMFYESELST